MIWISKEYEGVERRTDRKVRIVNKETGEERIRTIKDSTVSEALEAGKKFAEEFTKKNNSKWVPFTTL